MNAASFLRVDRWLGVPLCFFLTRIRALVQPDPPTPATLPRNLLFIKLAEQGSTVLAYPALRLGAEMVGRENVYFIALEENRFILDALGVIPAKNVITVSHNSRLGFFKSALAAIRHLRSLKLDAAVDMEFFSRGSAALTFMSGAKRRVGYHPFFGGGLYRGDLMTHRLVYNPHLHTSEVFLSQVQALRENPGELPALRHPATASPEHPLWVPNPGEVRSMKELVRRLTGGNPPLILLNPNASDLLPLRRWPADRYVQLAIQLITRFPEVCIGFTGGPEEAVSIETLVHQVGSSRCVSFAGKTTLRELLALFTQAEVLVTNDSGPAHFATLTPIKVITLFGPETPTLFAARSPRNRALWAGIPCSPCVSAYNNRQSPCLNNLCMQAISVETVLAQVVENYSEGVPSHSRLFSD
jgi:ADP-heptose:LPS heptosyltransferase